MNIFYLDRNGIDYSRPYNAYLFKGYGVESTRFYVNGYDFSNLKCGRYTQIELLKDSWNN